MRGLPPRSQARGSVVKGGFSFRAKRELSYKREVWQKGYNEHRMEDADDYAHHVDYIWMNPGKGLPCGYL